MNHRSILALVCLAGTATFSFAANPPAIPSESIAKKKELLFEDNMDGPTHDAKWHRVVDTFAFENGMLKGTQTRVKDIPAQDGKGTVTATQMAVEDFGATDRASELTDVRQAAGVVAFAARHRR